MASHHREDYQEYLAAYGRWNDAVEGRYGDEHLTGVGLPFMEFRKVGSYTKHIVDIALSMTSIPRDELEDSPYREFLCHVVGSLFKKMDFLLVQDTEIFNPDKDYHVLASIMDLDTDVIINVDDHALNLAGRLTRFLADYIDLHLSTDFYSEAGMFLSFESQIHNVAGPEVFIDLLDDLLSPQGVDEYDPFTKCLRSHISTKVCHGYDPLVVADRPDLGLTATLLAKSYIGQHNEFSKECDLPALSKSPNRRSEWLEPFDVCKDFYERCNLSNLLTMHVGFGIKWNTRFAHTWVVAPSETGKSTLFAGLIAKDLAKVAEDKCSVILMESNVDLVSSVSRFKAFAKGGALEGRLVLIEARDMVENPISLNLFDLGYGNIDDLSKSDRIAMQNVTLMMIEYVFRLVDNEFTSRQSGVFKRIARLMLTIKGANLDTLTKFLVHGPKEFETEIAALEDRQRAYWEGFDNRHRKTRSEILIRAEKLSENDTLSRLFSASETKVNFYKAMSESKVILIDTSHAQLGPEGAEIFGRFMIALVMAAAQRRLFDKKSSRKDTFFYIDEAHDYIARDTKLPNMLHQARKLRLGMIIAHQELSQVQNIVPQLISSTAIKMVGKVSPDDAKKLGASMVVDHQLILQLPMHSFMISANKQSPAFVPMPYKPDFFDFKDHAMTDAEYEVVLQDNRDSFSYNYDATNVTPIFKPEDPLDDDDMV